MTSSMMLRASAGLAVLCLALSGATAAWALPSDGGASGTVGVTIVDPNDTASPTPSSSSSSGGSTSGSGGSQSSSGGSTSGVGSAPSPTASQTLIAVSPPSGVVVGGVDAHPWRDLNPFAGIIRCSLSITNRTSAPINGRFSFRLVTPFGTQIGPTIVRDVNRVPVGQSRTRTVDLPGVGQWPLVLVSARFDQLPHQKGIGPIQREAWVFPVPWLLIALIIAAVAVFLILRLARPEWFLRPEPAVA